MTTIPFPISIGLIGAPGSGKVTLGELFQEKTKDFFAEHDSDLWIIENAGRTIQDTYDQAMGVFGSPIDDLRAYWLRQEQELAARAKGVSFISLGTAVDHIAHTGINLETVMTGLQTPDQEIKVQRGQITMTLLTMLLQEQFRYNFGFYVPHSGSTIVLPGEPDTENEYNMRIDRGIQMIFSNFNMRIQILDQPSLEEKAQVMADTVIEIMENGPQKPPEPEQTEPEIVEQAKEAYPELFEGGTEEDPSTDEATLVVDA